MAKKRVRIEGIKIKPVRATGDGAIRTGRRGAPRTGEDPAVLDIAYRICGDRNAAIKLAKRFMRLKQQYPDATLPEGITFAQLTDDQIDFVYQQDYSSGRVYYGGNVIDFWLPDYGNVIRVQGNFWHSKPERRERDEVGRSMLIGSFISGVRVQTVTDLWESRVQGCDRVNAIRLAVQGIELGP